MKSFLFTGIASVLVWGMYPVAVAMGDYGSVFIAASISTFLAGVIWVAAIAVSGVDLSHALTVARRNGWMLALTGFLFTAEVALFYLAVGRSPQTAAVLFEIWVLVFVIFSQLMGGQTRLSRKDWVFLAFGLIGVTVAVVDVRSMLAGEGSIPDPWAVCFALLSGGCMSVKTYLNAQMSLRLSKQPSVAVASLPHLLSSFIAVPLWLGLAWLNGDSFSVPTSEYTGLLLVALLYGVGVPLFIFAVAVRPNDSSMAIFYTIPLVAIALLYVFGFGELTFYFVLGASIIFIVNAMISQPSRYVSAAGIAAILTLLATYFAVSVQTDILPIGAWIGTSDTIPALEILLLFYGLLFAFVLTNVIETNKEVHRKMDAALNLVLTKEMPSEHRVALYRRILRLSTPDRALRNRVAAAAFEDQEAVAALEVDYRSLQSASTPTAIFRVFSSGVMLVLLFTFCLSEGLLERITGFLILSCTLYFVFYSRDSYQRTVTYPLLFSEVLSERRGKHFTQEYARRQGTHVTGLWLFVFAITVCTVLNVFIQY